MAKRKRTNNGQEKKDKLTIVCPFFSWPLFVLFLLTIVCPFSLDHCLSFFSDKQWSREKGQTMVKRKRTNNDQEKKDKQWPREKGQTMVKRKRTNYGQEKKDKQWPLFLLTIVCPFSLDHCLSFFSWPLFVLFLLTIVCGQEKKDKQWSREKGQTMVKRKRTNNGQEKKDKQWSREKRQTMAKRKRTNNGQEKKDKQWPREKGQTCPFSLDHCLSFFS
jgi:biopolymer transport protein ExbB/TolQ